MQIAMGLLCAGGAWRVEIAGSLVVSSVNWLPALRTGDALRARTFVLPRIDGAGLDS